MAVGGPVEHLSNTTRFRKVPVDCFLEFLPPYLCERLRCDELEELESLDECRVAERRARLVFEFDNCRCINVATIDPQRCCCREEVRLWEDEFRRVDFSADLD